MSKDIEAGTQNALPFEKSSVSKAKKSKRCTGWVAPLCIIGCILVVVLLWWVISVILSSVEASKSLKMLQQCMNDTSLSKTTTSLIVPDDQCNGENFKLLDLSKLKNLATLVVGDRCFRYVQKVNIRNLKQLKTVTIGKESFTLNREWYGQNPDFRLVLKNCPSLTHLSIGDHSFLEYTTCDLAQLPSLEIVEMGDFNSSADSSSFYWASLSLKSRCGLHPSYVDLPRLKSLLLGNHAFLYAKEVVLESTCLLG